MNEKVFDDLKHLEEKYHFKANIPVAFKEKPGISEDLVKEISRDRNEPQWMLEIRLKALKAFYDLQMPSWAPKFDVNIDELTFYIKPTEKQAHSWDEVPDQIKEVFDRLGIKEQEKEFLAGSGAMFESEMIFKQVKDAIAKQGVLFLSMDEAVQKYPELVRKYFGRLVTYNDNKFAALNTALWTSGTFIYVPKGVKVKMPLQTFYRMNFEATAQLERTLIIVEDNAEVHYMEGCTAPIYSKANLHVGVVEVFVGKNAKMRFSTVQNWSKNVINLTTKRGMVESNGMIEWVDGNLGSGITMKYPMIILKGDNAKGDILSIAVAGDKQNIDSGGKIVVLGNNCKGRIISKGISLGGGINSYRGLVRISKNSKNSRVEVNCDSLILDDISISNTYPKNINESTNSVVKHEATVGKIDEDLIFYLMSRGIKESDARAMIVLSFLNPVTKELPIEYAVELNKIIQMEMENSLG